MTTQKTLAVLTALFIPCAAFAAVAPGDSLGTSEADVRSALEAKGYTVLEIEVEDDEIEAEVEMDGATYEIEVALSTGLVSEIELEDDDDSDDDD